MMKGWRIITLKGDGVKKKEEGKYSFLAIVSNLFSKISKKVLQLCSVISPQVT